MLFEIFASAWFKYFVFPTLCALGTVVFKSITREDKNTSFRSEDWMIGPDLMWLSITIFAAGLTDKAAQFKANEQTVQTLAKVLQPEQIRRANDALDLAGRSESLISFLSASGFVMFSYIFVAVCVSVAVRQFGWVGPSKPHRLWGIAVPMLLGFLMLAVTMRMLTLDNV